jgi:hypothetical protein
MISAKPSAKDLKRSDNYSTAPAVGGVVIIVAN